MAWVEATRMGLARRKMMLAILSIAILACLALAFPVQAHAKFNDVTDSYPATQDIPVSGSELTASDVPEGTYSITATSSSYMCKFTNVTLTSAQGQLWVTFTMSKAYNALYPGTAEEAAASTNEEGTDYSAYYVSEPLEGYVARQFSIQIPALNKKMTIATYSGGSKGIEGGMWYTREVVFNSSSAVDKAVKGETETPAKQQDSAPEATQQTDTSTKTDASTKTDTSTQQETTSKTEKKSKSKEKNKKDSEKKESNKNNSSNNNNNSNNTTPPPAAGTGRNSSGNSPNAGSGSSASSGKSEDKGSSGASAPGSEPAGGAKMGQGISVVGVDVPFPDMPMQDVLADQQQQQSESGGIPLPAVIAGVCVVNLALAGAFVWGLRRAWRGGLPRGKEIEGK